MTKTETITIELPAHMKKWFVGVFAACVEQDFMEAYHGSEGLTADGITINYPFFVDPESPVDITIAEYKD